MAEKNKKNFLPSNLSAEEMKAPKVDSAHIEDFKTPEEIASAEANETGAVLGSHEPIMNEAPSQKIPKDPSPIKDKLVNFYKGHKKACIIGGVILVLVLVGGAYMLLKPEKKAVIAPIKVVKKVEAAKTVPSTLSGLPVDPSTNLRPVTGVMIENSLDARPQAGLGQAGVVYEAIAEGGITRFLALFQDTAPENIGPIRSARPYYVQWAMGFDAGYAHVGGSPEAIANIRDWGVKDLDQFYNSGAYHRTSDRAAPHNVYSSSTALSQLEAAKGYTSSTFTGFIRNAKAKPIKLPTAKSIDMAISSASYNVHYDYNVKTNSYDRSEGSAPHIDANTNTQISPKVAIAMVTSYGIQSDGKHSEYGVIGSGQAFVFQNGEVIVGTWTKADNKSQTTFTDAAGAVLKLNAGQTWITTLSDATKLNYVP